MTWTIGIAVLAVLLLVGGIALALGYAWGQRSAAQPIDAPQTTPPRPTAQAKAEPTPAAAPAPATTPPRRGLHISTDPANNERLVVHLDGIAYLRYDAMTDEDRRRLRTYLLQVRDWIQLTGGAAVSGSPKPTPRRTTAPAASSQRAPASGSAPSRPSADPKDMLNAINDIVKRKSRELRLETSITLMQDWRTGGVVILVAGERYEAVDDIPDPVVQRVVRDAVREWESGAQG